MNPSIKIIECPRDAMQGLALFIPTALKVDYINKLLRVGFDTIDFGSFVSPKAVPQMADTTMVLDQLDSGPSHTKLLAIIANTRGAAEAAKYGKITYLGFPLSISDTFQRRNTNKSIPEALNSLEEIKNICVKANKKLVTYISMGFGNPYGDPYEVDLVLQFVDILMTLGSDVISLADTIGVAESPAIESLFSSVCAKFPQAEIGAHLHSTPLTSRSKIEGAWRGGCRRFDGALRGFGGCPMAKDELVGNIATETIVSLFEEEGVLPPLDKKNFLEALSFADKVFLEQ
ncbi:MAG: hydroxymethylglutaryl-CoA lyase [Cyclobacteriaceae bacterium]